MEDYDFYTDTFHFGKTKGESITSNHTEEEMDIQKLLKEGYHIVNGVPMKNPLEDLVIKSTIK